MNKRSVWYFISVAFVIVLVVSVCTGLMSSTKSRTISFIPDDVTQFLYSYLDTCMEHPENAVDYVHFESDIERDAFSQSNLEILDYEILGSQKINNKLYAFTLKLEKPYDTYPKRYYFVGSIENELYLMVNTENVPNILQDGFNKDNFMLSSADLNGAIPVSPDSIG